MTTIASDDARVSQLRTALLDWYGRDGRSLPWRVRGAVADPYRVWLSEVMLQQTTVPHAAPYYLRFLELWPTVRDLASAADERVMAEWAGLGYYSRARNLIKCARAVVADYGGVFPSEESELLKLPGFGPYTAAAVAAFAFGRAANVVDGNVERVMSRLYAVDTPVPAARPRLRELSALWVRAERASDWPQALMDLASLICRPKSPSCLLCPLQSGCMAFAKGEPERFPVKAAKGVKPRRYGVTFVILSGDGFIAERRPEKGLLGGMLGLPHLEWRGEAWGEGEVKSAVQSLQQDLPPSASLPPPSASAAATVGEYEHVFTHFALTQQVVVLRPTEERVAAMLRSRNDWLFLPLSQKKALPTVFSKALKLADL